MMGKAFLDFRLRLLSMLCLASLILAGCSHASTASHTDASSGDTPISYMLKVAAEAQSVDIIREDDDTDRRLVYLRLTNAAAQAYEGYSLRYEVNGKTLERPLGDIKPHQVTVYDTLWLPRDMDGVEGTVVNDSGEVAWKGTITVQKAQRESIIQKSAIYTEKDLKPLMLRGSNYYPRHAAWRPISEQEGYWEEEFGDFVSRLHLNTLRLIGDFDGFGSRKGGNVPTPEYLERLNKLFETAAQHQVKVIFCLYPDRPKEDGGMNMRYIRAAMEPFINDGRILMWDLINEIDSYIDDEPYFAPFVQKFYPMMKTFDANHITNIGMANTIGRVADLGVDFDVWQYHYYGPPEAEFMMRMERTYFPGKPWMLGEFGWTSMPGQTDSAISSDDNYQKMVYEKMLGLAPKLVDLGLNLVGVCNWCVYDFSTHTQESTGQGYYGMIRTDGSMKPAGEVLAAHYARWERENPAPWE